MQLTRSSVPLSSLPDELIIRAYEQARVYSISFASVKERDDDRNAIPASGTFIRVNETRGILTACHVWKEAIRASSTTVLTIGEKRLRIPRTELHAFVELQGNEKLEPYAVRVPDLAFVALSRDSISSIEAQGRAFYSLDRRVTDGNVDLNSDDGFHVAIGNPNALVDWEQGRLASFAYSTIVSERFSRNEWDYALVRLDLDEDRDLPRQYGGISGGGLWRVRLGRDTSGAFHLLDVVLVGTIIGETGEEGRQLIAHGAQSIYQRLPENLPS